MSSHDLRSLEGFATLLRIYARVSPPTPIDSSFDVRALIPTTIIDPNADTSSGPKVGRGATSPHSLTCSCSRNTCLPDRACVDGSADSLLKRSDSSNPSSCI